MKENLEVMVDERTKQLRIYETIVENTDEAIYITDAKANIIKVNNAFEQITGYSESEVLKKSSKMLQSGKHSKSFYKKKMWDSIVENGSWSGEIWDKKKKDGTVFPQILTVNSVVSDSGDALTI